MPVVAISVGGADVTADVVFSSATFKSLVNGQPGEAYMRVRDLTSSRSFTEGDDWLVTVDGSAAWRGFVTSVIRTFIAPALNVADQGLQRFIDLRGADLNILFSRRVVFDVGTPTNVEGTQFPAGTADTTAITELLDNWLDLSTDDLDTTSGVTNVGDLDPAEKTRAWSGGWYWGNAMDSIAMLPAAIYYLRPEVGSPKGTLCYVDVDVPTAPFGLSDIPNGSTTKGYREMEIVLDGTSLANDVLARGVGYGSQAPVIKRLQSGASQTLHGLWQTAVTAVGVYKQATIDRIADSILNGSPSSHRGAKNDRPYVSLTTYDPGLLAGHVVDFESQVWGYSDAIPVRQLLLLFEAPDVPRYEVILSHEIDAPWGFVDQFWPKIPQIPGPPFPPLPSQPPGNPSQSQTCFGTPCGPNVVDCRLDRFQRTFGAQDTFGTADWSGSAVWVNNGIPGDQGILGCVPGNASIDLSGPSGPLLRNNVALPITTPLTGDYYVSFTPTNDSTTFPSGGWPAFAASRSVEFCQFQPFGYTGHGVDFLYVRCIGQQNWNPTFDPLLPPTGRGDLLIVGTGNGAPDSSHEVSYNWDAGTTYNIQYHVEGGNFWVKINDVLVWSSAESLPSSSGSHLLGYWANSYFFSATSGGSWTGGATIHQIGYCPPDSGYDMNCDPALIDVFDNFDRNLSLDLGTTIPTGYPWVVDTAPSHGGDFGVSPTPAPALYLIGPGSGSVDELLAHIESIGGDPWAADFTCLVKFTPSAAPTGGEFGEELGFFIENDAETDYFGMDLLVRNDGLGYISVTDTASQDVLTKSDWVAGDSYYVRWGLSAGSVVAKVWRQGDTEPGWQVTLATAVTVSDRLVLDMYIDQSYEMDIAFIDFNYAGRPCYYIGSTPVPPIGVGPPQAPSGWGCQEMKRISSTVYAATTPFIPNATIVWREGLFQTPITHYTADPATGQITFTSSVGSSEVIRMCYFGTGPAA